MEDERLKRTGVGVGMRGGRRPPTRVDVGGRWSTLHLLIPGLARRVSARGRGAPNQISNFTLFFKGIDWRIRVNPSARSDFGGQRDAKREMDKSGVSVPAGWYTGP
jgi:hypothetical protein